MSHPISKASPDNQQLEGAQVGIEMVLIRCKFCNRPQMEVSDNSAATVRWKCKSCRNWNAFEFSPQIAGRGGKLKIKFVQMGGR